MQNWRIYLVFIIFFILFTVVLIGKGFEKMSEVKYVRILETSAAELSK